MKKRSLTAKVVNKLAKYKWFRRSCGGHWLFVSSMNGPKLINLGYWTQYEQKVYTDFKDLRVYTEEYWGDAYTFVDKLLEKRE